MTIEIKVCMGSACFVRGNLANIEFIEKFIKENALEAKIELVGEHCKGYCFDGPVIYVDGKQYSAVTEDSLKEILESLVK